MPDTDNTGPSAATSPQGVSTEPTIQGTTFGRITVGAEEYARDIRKERSVDLYPTPAAVATWNEAQGKTIGIFHVTC
jgi:hypothetical protein